MALGIGRQFLPLFGQCQDVVNQRSHQDQQGIPLKRSHGGGPPLGSELSQLFAELGKSLLAIFNERMRICAECSYNLRFLPRRPDEQESAKTTA
jgi:hypothetical protein